MRRPDPVTVQSASANESSATEERAAEQKTVVAERIAENVEPGATTAQPAPAPPAAPASPAVADFAAGSSRDDESVKDDAASEGSELIEVREALEASRLPEPASIESRTLVAEIERSAPVRQVSAARVRSPLHDGKVIAIGPARITVTDPASAHGGQRTARRESAAVASPQLVARDPLVKDWKEATPPERRSVIAHRFAELLAATRRGREEWVELRRYARELGPEDELRNLVERAAAIELAE